MRPGRLCLLAVGAAYVVALAWAALVLPERVPSHFDGSGRVDDWSSRTGMLVFWGVTGVIVLVLLPLLTRAVAAGDGTWVGTGSRDGVPWWVHVLLLGGYLAATAGWTVQLLRRYRAPGET